MSEIIFNVNNIAKNIRILGLLQLRQKNAVSVFHGFGFSIQKMSIALHITFVENDQNYYFASNHTPDGQHCYVRL